MLLCFIGNAKQLPKKHPQSKPLQKGRQILVQFQSGNNNLAISERTNVERIKRTKMKRTDFYLNLVNNHLSKKIKLFYAYGETYVKTESGNETLFCGTEKQVYYYLVGVERLLNEQK